LERKLGRFLCAIGIHGWERFERSYVIRGSGSQKVCSRCRKIKEE